MSFIFPLCWKHTLIPILPADMIDVIDAPLPFLIGIESEILNEYYSDLVDSDVTRVDLDSNKIYSTEPNVRDTFKISEKDLRNLKSRLEWATACIEERPDPEIEQIAFAFSTVFIDPEDEGDGIDHLCVRDAFLEFM